MAQHLIQVRTNLLVNNNINIVDREDDDSPLVEVRFVNEAQRLSESQRITIGRAVAAFVADFLSDARARVPQARG